MRTRYPVNNPRLHNKVELCPTCKKLTSIPKMSEVELIRFRQQLICPRCYAKMHKAENLSDKNITVTNDFLDGEPTHS